MIQYWSVPNISFLNFILFSIAVLNSLCISHTYLPTPWCRVLLEQLTGLQLVKKFPAFHGTRRFITALTSVRHLSLSWASLIQSIYPHPTSWRYILILSTHLRLGLSSGLLPSGFPTKTLCATISSPIRATCPAHLILLDFITRTVLGEEYKWFNSSLCNLLHSPATSSLLGPNRSYTCTPLIFVFFRDRGRDNFAFFTSAVLRGRGLLGWRECLGSDE